MNNLNGKVCIVTGSTSGIGLVTAKEFAKMGATVIVVSRHEERGITAFSEIASYAKSDKVDLLMCDFASQASIAAFCQKFKQKYDRLDILVNNAGLMSQERIETVDGIELTFAVNHLGYFMTTNLLLDMLKATPNSRIIVVSSDLHLQGKIDFNNLMHEHNYHGFAAYCDSKLANLLFTYKMASLLKNTNTSINTLHPGVIKTKFSVADRNSNMTFPMGRLSPEEGAKAQIYLSTAPELQGITGQYFNQKVMQKSSALSYDQALADMLWQKSIELCPTN